MFLSRTSIADEHSVAYSETFSTHFFFGHARESFIELVKLLWSSERGAEYLACTIYRLSCQLPLTTDHQSVSWLVAPQNLQSFSRSEKCLFQTSRRSEHTCCKARKLTKVVNSSVSFLRSPLRISTVILNAKLSSAFPDECRYNPWNHATMAFLHIIFNQLLTKYPFRLSYWGLR